ncbi:hypothetical protein C2S51_017046 [Perilla frutescens var. frutescens]|nr:hypothetical protein C2S51_017046 [Perilla frutescens var. frutescens]
MDNTPIYGVSSVKGDNGSTTQAIYLQGNVISIKLNESNYLLWKQQVLATLEGFGLEGFLTGERKCPESCVLGTLNEDIVPNPEFIAWNRQDKLIMSWLLSSMTNGILVGVTGLTTTKEIWDTLESNFTSQSRAKLMQLKYQLQTLKKGSMTMHEYLNKVKTYCDMLGAAGEKVTDENQILHILAGPGSEYNHVMVSITSRVEPCSLREARAMLLHFEDRLEFVEQPSFSSDGSSLSANFATHTPQSKNYYSQGGN